MPLRGELWLFFGLHVQKERKKPPTFGSLNGNKIAFFLKFGLDYLARLCYTRSTVPEGSVHQSDECPHKMDNRDFGICLWDRTKQFFPPQAEEYKIRRKNL
jgi:hypothetical protein